MNIGENISTISFLLNKMQLLVFLSCEYRCRAINVYDSGPYVYNKINEELKTAGLDVKAEDIIDVINGYHGKGYGISSQEELGGYPYMHRHLRDHDLMPLT